MPLPAPRVVYMDKAEESSLLMLCDLGQFHATPLADTEGAQSLLFSPDGSSA
jgi:hypothetical protein